MFSMGEKFLLFLVFCFVLFKFLPFYYAISILIVAIGIIRPYLKHDKSYWMRHNILGPEPHLLLGNLKDFGRGMHVYDVECTQKYGSTYGSYLFGLYELCSSDLNIIRQILVKDSNCFVDRLNVMPSSDKNEHNLHQNILTLKRGDDWKRIRNLMTPIFTTKNLKMLVPHFEYSSKELCDVIETYAKEDREIPLKKLMSQFTMSVIARTAFGIDVDAFSEQETPFAKNTREYLEYFLDKKNPALIFMMAFPTLATLIEKYTSYSFVANKQMKFFEQVLEELFEQRQNDRDSSKKYSDFFQLMLNCIHEEASQNDNTSNGSPENMSRSFKNSKHISKVEVLAQSFLLLQAGYETTAFTMHMVLYALSKLPEVQGKVREEIYDVIGKKDHVSYDDLMQLPYLSQVIQETLRMYPPTARVNRMCTASTTISGIDFKPNMCFSVPIYVIHYDDRYYPEPEKFDPDRFTPEEKAKRDPFTYLPFGYGLRNCIGMRFADLEIKMALVSMIRKFRFISAENSPDLPVKINTQFLTRTEEILHVKAEKV